MFVTKLPKWKIGLRRIFDSNDGSWHYIPIPYPRLWNRKTEFLMWDSDTDNWERVKKRDGFIPKQTKENHVESNLKKRIAYVKKQQELKELAILFEKVVYFTSIFPTLEDWINAMD